MPNASPTRSPTSHLKALALSDRREGAGGHRPRPRRAHRQLHHQRVLKASALSRVAEALAATDPDRAERIANSITDESSKASALSGVAEALAATDPDRAGWLLADAERIADSITPSPEGIGAERRSGGGGGHRPRPRRAHRRLHHRESAKALALSGIAEAVAATDPDRAERIAYSITDKHLKASALVGIAKALI